MIIEQTQGHAVFSMCREADGRRKRMHGGVCKHLRCMRNVGWVDRLCIMSFHVSGTGVTMKLMDEVAGIVAARHCNTNIVTASVDAINFHRKIKKGENDEE